LKTLPKDWSAIKNEVPKENVKKKAEIISNPIHSLKSNE